MSRNVNDDAHALVRHLLNTGKAKPRALYPPDRRGMRPGQPLQDVMTTLEKLASTAPPQFEKRAA